MIVRDQALAFERRQNGSVEPFGQLDDPGHREAGAGSHDNHGSARTIQCLDCSPERLLRRRYRVRGHPSFRTAGTFTCRSLQCLNLIGEDEVGHTSVQNRTLDRQIDQLGVLAGVQHGLAPLSHLPVCRLKIDLLEGTGTQDLGVDLAGQGQGGRPIDVGVPESRQQVSGTRAGDRQTRCGPTRQFSVGGTGERRNPLMANAVVGHLALLLLDAQSVGEPQIRVTDHSKHGRYAPVDHGFSHQVRDGPHMSLFFFEAHIDPVCTHLDRKGSNPVVIPPGRPTRKRVEVPSMPGAAQQAVLDTPLPKGSTLVGAFIVESSILALEMGQTDGLVIASDRLDPPVRESFRVEDLLQTILR